VSQLGEGPDPQEKAIWGGHLPGRRTDDGRAKDAEPLKWVGVHRGNGCVRVCYWEHWQCRLRVICEEQSEDATPSRRLAAGAYECVLLTVYSSIFARDSGALRCKSPIRHRRPRISIFCETLCRLVTSPASAESVSSKTGHGFGLE